MNHVSPFRSLVTRVLLMTTLSVAVAAFLVGLLSYWSAIDELREHELVDLRDEAHLKVQQLQTQFTQLRTDTLALRSNAKVLRYLAGANGDRDQKTPDEKKQDEKRCDELHDLFKSVCRSFVPAKTNGEKANEYLKPYLQVRLLDRNGREIAVVYRDDRDAERPFLDHEDPADLLGGGEAYQKSATQYYRDAQAFSETLNREVAPDDVFRDPIFFSAIENNVDNSKVRQLQTQPVLRASSPILSSEGELIGMVVINLDFNEATSQLVSSPRHLIYLSENGKRPKNAGGIEYKQARLLYHPTQFDVSDTFSSQEQIRDLGKVLEKDLSSLPEEFAQALNEKSELPEYGYRGNGKRPLEGRGLAMELDLSEEMPFWLTKLSAKPKTDLQKRLHQDLRLARAKGDAKEKLPFGFRGPVTQLPDSTKVISLRARSKAELLEQAEIIQSKYPGNAKPQYKTLFGNLCCQRCRKFHSHYFRVYFDPLRPSRHIGLIIGFSEDELYADLGPTRWQCLRVGAAVVVLVIAMVLLFMHQLVSAPIAKLTNAAKQIGMGNFDVELPSDKHDEIGHLATTFDRMIGQLHQRQVDVREREEHLSAIFSTVVDGILTVDGQFRIQAMNQAAENLFGRSRDALIHRTVDVLFDEETEDGCLTGQLTNTTSHADGHFTTEATGIRKTNNSESRFPARISMAKVEGQDLFALVITDITQVKQYRETLEHEVNQRTKELVAARDEALASERASDTFISSVNHELRNPLHKILSNCQRLERRQHKYGPLTEKQEEILDAIKQAVRKQEELIGEVLDLKKIKAGALPIEIERFEVKPFLDGIVAGLVDEAQGRGTEMRVVGVQGGEMISTDRRKLEAILVNLLSNASKFTRDGTITIQVVATAGSCFSALVKDTGKGMTPQQQQGLFEQFNTNRDSEYNPDGIGLGLVYARSLARRLGGNVTLVRSEVDVGTTFSATVENTTVEPTPMKLASASGESKLVVPQRSERDGEAVVLVIDDDPDASELIRDLLDEQRMGAIRIESAISGIVGLEIARKVLPDLILLDIKLPGIDGWSVLAAIQADEHLKHIPVVPLTIVNNPQKAMALGASDYLMKPVSPDHLNRIFQHYCVETPSILIVDDDAEDRSFVREIMEDTSFEVREAENGREAIALIDEKTPDLILLDLEMPEMGGAELLTHLQRSDSTRQIPVVVLTARDPTDPQCLEIKHVVDQLLHKNATDDSQLLSIIDRILSGFTGHNTSPPPAPQNGDPQ